MTKSEGKKTIEAKTAEFHEQEKLLKKKGHGETNIRTNFIDVFFESLGWNMKSYRDVVREYAQKDSSGTKKVDYAFFINGKVKFFVEAKESSVDLEHDKDVIYQAKRYAFSTNGKAPIIILTDFEEFRVFNVLKAPLYDNIEKDLLKNLCLKYTDYAEKWNLIWDTFSKEAVAGGSLNALIGKIDKNTRTMDVEFLEQITDWRETLAKYIALRNTDLTVDEINEAVQRILDRLIFIRNLEDREIEPENTLLDIAKNREDVYKHLLPMFAKFDNLYNGLLFKKHFSEDLAIDDKVLKDIIKKMCYPVSPFQFDVIEPEILGRIYEKFLGSKIRLTETHQAKVEEKIEVRKAGGVYYTPEYIVNYIVENTAGKKIDGLSPDEIKNIKIVDPACGSGSFLLGAFTHLLDYHEKWYMKNKSDRKYKEDYYVTKSGELKVAIDKRAEILKNNIFGVDIDKEATEVAIMSLYLKMLDEGFDKGQRDLFFIKGHILPDMSENIKCGNSLIGTDYFEGNLNFNNEELKKIKPFDWDKQFPEAFKQGGFDVVIGNPPWVSLTGKFGNDILSKKELEYLIHKYDANTYMPNIYEYFISKGLQLINQFGLFSFIVPDRFGLNEQFLKLRKNILFNYKILDLLYKAKFPNIIADTLIFIIENNKLDKYLINVGEFNKKIYQIENIKYLNNEKYCFTYNINNEISNVINKIDSLINKKIIADAFETTSGFGGISTKITNIKENDKQIKVIKGKNIERYFINGVLYFEFKKDNITGRTTDKEKLGFKEKILLRKTGYPIYATYDNSGIFPEQSLYFLFNKKTELGYYFYLSIINSKLFQFYYWNKLVTNRDSTPQLKKIHLDIFPFPNLDLSNTSDKQRHDSLVSLVDNMLQTRKDYHGAKSDGDKKLLEQKIGMIDGKIDGIVYSLYGLTDDEIRIIEGEE